MRKGKITTSSMLTWPAGYELQMLRVYTRIHGGQQYDYKCIYLYLAHKARMCAELASSRAHVLVDSSVLSISMCIQLECQSFRKVGTIIAEGRDTGQRYKYRDCSANIGTVGSYVTALLCSSHQTSFPSLRFLPGSPRTPCTAWSPLTWTELL